MPKNAIVVGMPRSGTSLAASIFARQGYYVAADTEAELRAGDQFNPGGYWEAGALIEANVSLFRRANYSEHNTWRFSKIAESSAKSISNLQADDAHISLVKQYEKHRPWVWKDPRLCYTLGYWWKLVNQDETRVLLVQRDAESILRSFRRIGWRNYSDSDRQDLFDRVESHNAAASNAIEVLGIPHVVVEYSEYSKNSESVAKRIGEHFDLPLRSSDIGYTDQYNSSTVRGRLRIAIEKIVKIIPQSARDFVKRLIPKKLLKKLFPGRRTR